GTHTVWHTTRSINYDASEWYRKSIFFLKTIVLPIVTNRMNNSCAQPLDVMLYFFQPLQIAVACHDGSMILHNLRDVARFPARRCTRVEDFFSRFRIEELAGERGAWILNVGMT